MTVTMTTRTTSIKILKDLSEVIKDYCETPTLHDVVHNYVHVQLHINASSLRLNRRKLMTVSIKVIIHRIAPAVIRPRW